jgi:hypothetical protein
LGRPRPAKKKNIPNERIIRLLRQSYAFKGDATNKSKAGLTLKKLAQKTGWTVAGLRDLATTLGLSQTTHGRPQRPWHPDEIEIVRKTQIGSLNHSKALLRRKHFVRSSNEIRDKRTELAHLGHSDCYSSAEASRLLGFNGPKAINALIDRGQLKKDGTPKSVHVRISRAAIRAFLLTCPDSYELPKVDRVFFTMLVLTNSFPEAASQK